jgi:hypothetical protein
LEEALAGWLRKQVSRIEEQRERAPEALPAEKGDEYSKLAET